MCRYSIANIYSHYTSSTSSQCQISFFPVSMHRYAIRSLKYIFGFEVLHTLYSIIKMEKEIQMLSLDKEFMTNLYVHFFTYRNY